MVGVGVGVDVDLVPQDTANIRQKLIKMASDRAAFFLIEILISVLRIDFFTNPKPGSHTCQADAQFSVNIRQSSFLLSNGGVILSPMCSL